MEKFAVGCANATATPHYPLVHIPWDALLIAMSITYFSDKKTDFEAQSALPARAERKSRSTIIAKSGFFESHHNYGKCCFWTCNVFQL
jgi:hypothetical protein